MHIAHSARGQILSCAAIMGISEQKEIMKEMNESDINIQLHQLLQNLSECIENVHSNGYNICFAVKNESEDCNMYTEKQIQEIKDKAALEGWISCERVFGMTEDEYCKAFGTKSKSGPFGCAKILDSIRIVREMENREVEEVVEDDPLKRYEKWMHCPEEVPNKDKYDWVIGVIREKDTGYVWIPRVIEYRHDREDWYDNDLGWLKGTDYEVVRWVPIPE